MARKLKKSLSGRDEDPIQGEIVTKLDRLSDLVCVKCAHKDIEQHLKYHKTDYNDQGGYSYQWVMYKCPECETVYKGRQQELQVTNDKAIQYKAIG